MGLIHSNPLHDRYGFRYWKTPGPFAGVSGAKNVVRGIFDSVCWAAFA